ncbi:hypothetical protein RJ639_030622 [Escallonia herrerae]|uniref:3-hydroxyisobutyryl-CoA hydrolase n=1 Tax=Escallonia herrerae TaxID=1293975 RepID=A0AA89BE25_9ASTE|nr:hypothetical protein RJ639_030622 [Escallonia herrerae]
MKGSGRAFCSGGDVITIYQVLSEGKVEECKTFYQTLYKFVYLLGTYLKPHAFYGVYSSVSNEHGWGKGSNLVAILDGYTMGGGAGISLPGMFRVATDKTVIDVENTQCLFGWGRGRLDTPPGKPHVHPQKVALKEQTEKASSYIISPRDSSLFVNYLASSRTGNCIYEVSRESSLVVKKLNVPQEVLSAAYRSCRSIGFEWQIEGPPIAQVFSTPEAQMGFHPDAGASFYLSRLPGYLGNPRRSDQCPSNINVRGVDHVKLAFNADKFALSSMDLISTTKGAYESLIQSVASAAIIKTITSRVTLDWVMAAAVEAEDDIEYGGGAVVYGGVGAVGMVVDSALVVQRLWWRRSG